MLFANRIALVTGAGSGIGRAIALALAAQGARVWLVGRNAAKLDETASLACGDTVCCPCDLAVDGSIDEMIGRVAKEQAGLDILVHSAAVFTMGPVSDARVEDLDAQYRINLRAVFVLTKACLPLLRTSKGQVVFMNSSAGVAARAGISQYAATKHALKALADSLREEVNADGIRVLSLFLGRTATPMQRSVRAMEGREYDPAPLIQPEDAATMIVAALSMAGTAEVTAISMRPLQPPGIPVRAA